MTNSWRDGLSRQTDASYLLIALTIMTLLMTLKLKWLNRRRWFTYDHPTGAKSSNSRRELASGGGKCLSGLLRCGDKHCWLLTSCFVQEESSTRLNIVLSTIYG